MALYRSYNGVDMGIPKLTLERSASYKVKLGAQWALTPFIDYSYRGVAPRYFGEQPVPDAGVFPDGC